MVKISLFKGASAKRAICGRYIKAKNVELKSSYRSRTANLSLKDCTDAPTVFLNINTGIQFFKFLQKAGSFT